MSDSEKTEPNTKPKHPNLGGRRPGSGRKKGSPNKVTAEIKKLAHKYGPGALKELARLAREAESEQARVSACREILDRAYGRAMQPIQGDLTYGISEQLAELFRGQGTTAGDGALGAEIARRAANGSNGQHH